MSAIYRHSCISLSSKGTLKYTRFALRVVINDKFLFSLSGSRKFLPKSGRTETKGLSADNLRSYRGNMKSKKSKSKVQSLNLKNPKQRDIINLFAVSEGRVGRQDILSTGNKEIMYRMINLGYIKETVKGSGIYKATAKLKKITEQTTGKKYNNGCSNKHSAIMSKTVTKVIPKSVLSYGRYTGQNEIKSRTDKFKHTPQYRQGLRLLKDKAHKDYKDCYNRYNNSVSYQQKLDARKDLEIAAMKKQIIDSDNPSFTPDIEITISRAEAEELLQNIREIADSSDGREHSFMMQNEEKLERLLGTTDQTFTIGCEIVTENYGNEELFRHQVYEILTGEQVLYFC